VIPRRSEQRLTPRDDKRPCRRTARSVSTPSPAWIDTAVVYGVVPHNFGPHGLRSVTARLDSLQDLGITALWLAPITATPTQGHGYEVTDYFRVRWDYGTKRDLQALVKAAHARGIRVLLDVVPNHSSREHPYFVHAERHGKRSPYYRYYDRGADGTYTHYFDWSHLPNLSYDHPEVRRWMVEASAYWVRECDVDGFRVDAAWGVQWRRPDFWPRWQRELRRLKPDLLLLAEAGARDPYWFESGFDAAYDWTDELGQWAWHDVFEEPDHVTTRLHSALTNEGRGFPEQARVFRFLNNNDTGKRFITRYGITMERVAAALLLTLPGLPCIYTGQEYGAEFEPYGTLDPIAWEGHDDLRRYYQRLIALRRRHPALHSPPWQWVQPRLDRATYAYLRTGHEGDPVLVALNFSRRRAAAEVALTAETRPFAEAPQLTDLLTGRGFSAFRRDGDVLHLSLPPRCARVLVAGTSEIAAS
jgi:cyclomaltodextrinase